MPASTPPPVNYRLYLVTDPDIAGGPEKVDDIVVQAVRGGVTVVQLRDKHATDDQVERRVRSLQEVLPDTPIVVNDRVEVAQKTGVHLHIGQNDMPYHQARALLDAEQHIGLSIENFSQLEAIIADCDSRGIAYPDLIGIGPVWATATKADHAPPLGVEEVDRIAVHAHQHGIASVAIGGVNHDTAPLLQGNHVDGICVVSCIMGAPDPTKAAQELLQLWHPHTGR